MDELSALRERLATQRPVAYDEMPDFPLYMDQMLSYMERQVLRFDDGDALTAAMVNNYTKSGLLPRAEGKKYNREHLCYLTAVCILKRVMSVKDVELLLSAVVPREDVAGGYEAFRADLDRSLNLVTDVMEGYPAEEDTAQAALHFALLSYAAGVASGRYVSLLRRQREEQTDAPKKGRKSVEKTKV